MVKSGENLEKFGIQNGSARIDIAMDPQKILGLLSAEKRLRAIYTAAKHLTECAGLCFQHLESHAAKKNQ